MTHLHDNCAGGQGAAALNREQELVRPLLDRNDVHEVFGGAGVGVRDEFGVHNASGAKVKKKWRVGVGFRFHWGLAHSLQNMQAEGFVTSTCCNRVNLNTKPVENTGHLRGFIE